jgi:hypothetical protein
MEILSQLLVSCSSSCGVQLALCFDGIVVVDVGCCVEDILDIATWCVQQQVIWSSCWSLASSRLTVAICSRG